MVSPEKCTGCSACAVACPENAIKMVRAADGFSYPQIDRSLCSLCTRCRSVCPQQKKAAPERENRFYAVRSRDRQKRLQSTSGGVFRLLAEQTLRDGGAVFGAAFDRQFRVAHVCAETQDELLTLLGAKYVQSDPADTFMQTEKLLAEGRPVLYCTSPCMADGLLHYLGGCPEGLLLIDHVCFGVPSPGLWEAYIKWMEKNCGGPLTQYRFRDKRRPNNGHTVSFTAGGKEMTALTDSDPWQRLYLSNFTLRESCFTCRYHAVSRPSDLTIGDFWGIEKSHPELEDGYGVSLVITHGEKGEKALRAVLDGCEWVEVTQQQAMQPRLQEPPKSHMLRRFFLKDLASAGSCGNADMSLLLKKYAGVNLK